MPPQPQHERLDKLMADRILELGIGWEELARRAGLKYETIRGIRKGESRGAPLSRRAISVALGWTRDSVDLVLAGGDPAEAPLSLVADGQGAAGPAAEGDDLAAMVAAVTRSIMAQNKPLEQRERELQATLKALEVPGKQQALPVLAQFLVTSCNEPDTMAIDPRTGAYVPQRHHGIHT